MALQNPKGDYLMNHFTIELYALVERGLSEDDEPTRFELNAALLLAVRYIERQREELDRLSPDRGLAKATREAAAVAVTLPGGKCRHEFAEIVADGGVRCVKCGVPKKANGRPKKAVEVPAAAPAGEVTT